MMMMLGQRLTTGVEVPLLLLMRRKMTKKKRRRRRWRWRGRHMIRKWRRRMMRRWGGRTGGRGRAQGGGTGGGWGAGRVGGWWAGWGGAGRGEGGVNCGWDQISVGEGTTSRGRQVSYTSDSPTLCSSIWINPASGNRPPTHPWFIAPCAELTWREVWVLALLQSLVQLVETISPVAAFLWLSRVPQHYLSSNPRPRH